MKSKLLGVLIAVLFLTIAFNGCFEEEKEQIQEIIENTNMSYWFYGSYSPFRYIRVNITGYNATVSYQYFSSENATIKNLTLSKKNVSDFINKYQEMDFFNITVVDYFVYDMGTTEISLRYNNMNRTISYIATKNKNINELALMYRNLYWPLIEPEI